MNKAQMLARLKKCAKKLGRTPTKREICRMMKISERCIRNHFGNIGNAVTAAGLRARRNGDRLSLVTLVEDWARLARKVGRPPTLAEYRKEGRFARNTVVRRCGPWSAIGARFQAVAKEQQIEAEWADVLAIVEQWKGATTGAARRKMYAISRRGERRVVHPELLLRRKMLPGRPIYGTPIKTPVLRNAPTTEGGVMVAFGALAQQLGFAVERVQPAYPDCEALREVAPGKWQRVWIEFELASRNFLEHQHDPAKCDIIVCWVHNWPECPEEIEVIELGRLIG